MTGLGVNRANNTCEHAATCSRDLQQYEAFEGHVSATQLAACCFAKLHIKQV